MAESSAGWMSHNLRRAHERALKQYENDEHWVSLTENDNVRKLRQAAVDVASIEDVKALFDDIYDACTGGSFDPDEMAHEMFDIGNLGWYLKNIKAKEVPYNREFKTEYYGLLIRLRKCGFWG